MKQFIGNSRCWHWLLLVALCSPCWVVKANQGEEAMEAKTTSCRADLTGCTAGEDPVTGIFVRECTIEVTYVKTKESRSFRFGKGYLGRRATFTDMQIFDDTLIILTDAAIIALDLRKGETIKLIAANSAQFLSGRDLVLFNELELRRMPPEMVGRVLSVFDVSTLRRRPIFPEVEKLTELPVPGHPDSELKFEPFLRPKERGAACHTSRNYWNSDTSRLAFSCRYNLGRADSPSAAEAVAMDVIVVFLPSTISGVTFKKFEVYDRLHRKDVEIDLREGRNPIHELRWLDEDTLEIVATKRDWLHSGATINVVTDEFLLKD